MWDPGHSRLTLRVCASKISIEWSRDAGRDGRKAIDRACAFVAQRCLLRSCSLELEDNEVTVWSARREVWSDSGLPTPVVERQLPIEGYDGVEGVLVRLWRESSLSSNPLYSNYLRRAGRALHVPFDTHFLF